MSHDERLRRLERAFRASGAVEDEAEWLRERVRRGELDPARLDAAAVLGHPAALSVAGAPGDVGGQGGEVQRALTHLGPVAIGRAAVAAAELVLPVWERTNPRDPRPRLAVEAARAWTLCPCTPHLQEARALGLQVHAVEEASEAAGHAAHAAMRCGALLGTDRAVEALLSAHQAGAEPVALREALRSALVAWLLGGAPAPS